MGGWVGIDGLSYTYGVESSQQLLYIVMRSRSESKKIIFALYNM